MLCFVELLSLRVWFGTVFPFVFRASRSGAASVRVLYVDQTRLGSLAAGISRLVLQSLSVERLEFRLIDVRDENGLLVRLRIPYGELRRFVDAVVNEAEFRRFTEWTREEGLRAYVLKGLTKASLSDRQTIWRSLFLVQIFAWSARKHGETSTAAFLESRPWFATIVRYGAGVGLDVIPVPRTITRTDLSLEMFPPFWFWVLRFLRDSLLHLRFGTRGTRLRRPSAAPGTARLAMEYSGYFNLNRQECYSDFFFWQQSDMPGDRLLALFNQPADQIDAARHKQLYEQGIGAVALISMATATPSVPLHAFWPTFQERLRYTAASSNGAESRWLKKQVESYGLQREYWRDLFVRTNVRLYTTWYRFDSVHCVIGDAVKSLGGIMTVYQRACQPDASPEVAIYSDVAFGYAPMDAEVDRRSGSSVQYHVAVGYFGDHRFPLLRQQAEQVRHDLERHGARFVIAFFDENSASDERWQTGHRFQAENYEFLLEKLLADPSLGLVLKPKVPGSLKRRLGPVALLLDRALATGRCFLYQEGVVQGTYPPAAAAMSADIAIHGHLWAATAGLEAALAGTPTLLLDREGWRVSDMYELGVGRVVFASWPELWEALCAGRKHGFQGGLGDWLPMLDRLDPFRDGRGAERLGTYLNWLLEGLNSGDNRETTMANAAERYCRLWGHDKVRSITGMVTKEIAV
jgi:hypothetical protein